MEELELYLRKKIDELNKMAVFDIATETLKIWLDDYEPALSQHDVSGQSELLVNFLTWYVHNSDYGKIHEPIKAIVDDFIKLTNSH